MTESTARFEAASGDTVYLRLEREGVGGYVWSIGRLPPGLALAGEPERFPDAGDAVGGGAVLVAAIVANAPGRHHFTCDLRRPWGERDLAERRTVTVEVR